MSYWILPNDRGTYAVDWNVVNRIIRGYHRANYRWRTARVVKASEYAWWDWNGWRLPEVETIEVDWDQIRALVNRLGDEDFATLAEMGTRSVPAMANELRRMVAETARYNEKFIDLQATTQSENMARIQTAVNRAGTGIEVARFLRDTSADGLVVISTLLTAGAGAALLGGASALKGFGKYQDTDNIGAGILYGSGTFVFGAFKLGGAEVKGAAEVVVVLLQAQWETGVALAEGKSFTEALETGSLKLAGPLVDRFLKLKRVQKLLSLASIPITLGGEPGAKDVGNAVLSKWLGKIIQKQGVERGGKALIGQTSGQLHTPLLDTQGEIARIKRQAAGRPTLMESLTLSNDLLLLLAIVNMDKGIGRGL